MCMNFFDLKKIIDSYFKKKFRVFEFGIFELVVWWFIILFIELWCYMNYLGFFLNCEIVMYDVFLWI